MLDAAQYDLISQAIRTLFLAALPLTIIALVVGILVGALQSVSAIHDTALSYGLKLVAVAVTLYLILPSLAQSLVTLMGAALH